MYSITEVMESISIFQHVLNWPISPGLPIQAKSLPTKKKSTKSFWANMFVLDKKKDIA